MFASAYTLQNSIQTAAVLIVGRLGPAELSAAAFAMMLAMVTGWCVALGGTTALDTLGSQAFTGSKDPSDLSIHLQRCVFLLYLLLIPVLFLWFFVKPILLLLGQEASLSEDVQGFLRVLIIGAPGYIGFESVKKYLQCQGIMHASTVVLLVTSPLNVALNIWLVRFTSLGFLGSPLAVSITYWVTFLGLILYCSFSRTHHQNHAWAGLQLRRVLQLQPCLKFLQLAIPGILMVGTEWWAFEIVAIAAGRLGVLPLAAQSVIMTTDQILNTVPCGIGVAASNRIGNLIGSRSARGAARSTHAVSLLSVLLGSIIMILMLATRNVFGYLFSDDEAVVKLVSQILPLVASFQIADGLAASCGGVLRGQGRQHLGAIFNVVSYYIIALPLGITLAFRYSQGLQGLWIGQVLALFLVGFSEYATVWLGSNWEKEIQKGIERMKFEDERRESGVVGHLANEED
ncbi:MOP flippase [Calocera cornea HHB12733]|uniref:MOP flippase n=1 Tax=Calocera cornea HHB12733 TaxID=1353952 RepID=A0A165IU94_9BASI|nr:MOP flippase [Calocera cornea HHB12733]